MGRTEKDLAHYNRLKIIELLEQVENARAAGMEIPDQVRDGLIIESSAALLSMAHMAGHVRNISDGTFLPWIQTAFQIGYYAGLIIHQQSPQSTMDN